LCNPRNAALCVNGDEHNIWFPEVDVNTGGRLVAAWFVLSRMHIEIVWEDERPREP
jgi:hypothetical protein